MTKLFPYFAATAGATAGASLLVLAACSGDSPATIVHQDASTFFDAGVDVGVVDTGTDAPFDAGTKVDASDADASDAADAADTSTSGVGYFRIAHLAPGGPAFDVCLGKKSGVTYDFSMSAPLAKPQTAAGVAYTQVSRYFGFEAADYAVRFVAAGASSCATALDAKADVPVTLTNGGYATITAAGAWNADAGAPPFTTTVFVDDGPFAARFDAGAQSLVRVIREVTRAGTLDVGQNDLGNLNYVPLFYQVQNHATTAPNANGADAHGYVAIVWQGESASAHVDGDTTDLAVWNNVTIDVGEVATLFLVPKPNDALGVRALLCVRDFASTAQSALNATCTILP